MPKLEISVTNLNAIINDLLDDECEVCGKPNGLCKRTHNMQLNVMVDVTVECRICTTSLNSVLTSSDDNLVILVAPCPYCAAMHTQKMEKNR